MTALFAAAVFASLALMYMNTKAELAPEEDQGVLFALTKAPQYANLDYADAYGDKLDQAFASFPETDLRFVLNGRFGPNQGIAGAILKPWGERSRSAQQLKPLMQRKVAERRGAERVCFLSAAAAGDDRRPAGADGALFDRRVQRHLPA